MLLKPGTYRYRFLVDGEWRDDPECELRVANPFGTQDALLLVAEGAAMEQADHGLQNRAM